MSIIIYPIIREILLTTIRFNLKTDCCFYLKNNTGPDISVFDTAAQFGAWCGVCPGNRESAGKRRTHQALPVPRLSQDADRASRLQARHRGHSAQARTLHLRGVARHWQPYRDPMVDYERIVVQRNAARWLRQLEKFDLLQFQPDGSARVVFP